MKTSLRAIPVLLAAILLITACGDEKASKTPQSATPVADSQDISAAAEAETARLNAWFADKFEESVSRSPMMQTYLGRYTDYDLWDDPSDAHALEDLEIMRANIAEMHEKFDLDSLDANGKLSFRLAEYELEQAEAAFPYRQHGYTFNQMFGVQSAIPAFLINQHKITTEQDAMDYIARLSGIREYLGGHLENAKAAAEAGIRPPHFVYDYVLSDARNMLTGQPFDGAGQSPLMKDFMSKIDALEESGEITHSDHLRLSKLAHTEIKHRVGPAYQAVIDFLETDRQRASDEDGAWKLPNGQAYYAMRLAQMTTTDLSADEIHALGLAEVERIHTEMHAIMDEVGFEGSLKDFFDLLRTDAQFFKPNTEEGRAEYLAEATAIIEAMKGDLPRMFNTFPKAELMVKAVEPFREKSAGKAFYQRPATDGSRPGTYYANLYNMTDMPVYQMEALAFHEGIPGHHMQLAIAQELTGIPEFRKYMSMTAYTEGWGLYSEYLPKEFGYYADPYSNFGRLAMELWRAARLVVDTGIHDKQWTRQQATQYLLDNTPNPEGDAVKAIDRYIVMPGQATAYKIGMLKILELRDYAKAELGTQFDIVEVANVELCFQFRPPRHGALARRQTGGRYRDS